MEHESVLSQFTESAIFVRGVFKWPSTNLIYLPNSSAVRDLLVVILLLRTSQKFQVQLSNTGNVDTYFILRHATACLKQTQIKQFNRN